MKLKIEIRMDNAAFEESQGIESARILAKLAKNLAEESYCMAVLDCPLFDLNGNRVGEAKVIE